MQAIESIHDLIKPLEDRPAPRKPIISKVKNRLQFEKSINNQSSSTNAFENVRRSIRDNLMTDYSQAASQNVLAPFDGTSIDEDVMDRAIHSRVTQLNKRTTAYKHGLSLASLRQMPMTNSPQKPGTRFRFSRYRAGTGSVLPSEPVLAAGEPFLKAKIQNSIEHSVARTQAS